MRIGISYSGITGKNGADHVARFLWRAGIVEGHTMFMVGEEGGAQSAELPPRLDCIIHSSGFGLTPELVEKWKQQTRVFLWTHNDEIGHWRKRIEPITKEVTQHFSYTAQHGYGEHVHHLPLGADHTCYYQKHLPKVFDVCMIGAAHPWRTEFCRRLAEKFPSSYFHFGMQLSDEQINDAYNQTRIVLGFCQDCDQFQKDNVPVLGLPCRTFDVPCSGALHLQVWRESLSEIFSNKIHLGITCLRHFASMDEAVLRWEERINQLLSMDAYREEIAAEMGEEIRQRHTYAHRLRRMLEFM